MLVEACEAGADLIGGCPSADSDPAGHVERIFAIARRFDLDCFSRCPQSIAA
jgi:cytosine deaminase